jgi:hypothetical protein
MSRMTDERYQQLLQWAFHPIGSAWIAELADGFKAERAELNALREGLRQPFVVVFMDGRNEIGTHLLPMPPYWIDDKEFYEIFDPKDGTAERVFSEAEKAGHSVGHCVVVPLIAQQCDGGAYYEAGSPCAKLTAILAGTPAEQQSALIQPKP